MQWIQRLRALRFLPLPVVLLVGFASAGYAGERTRRHQVWDNFAEPDSATSATAANGAELRSPFLGTRERDSGWLIFEAGVGWQDQTESAVEFRRYPVNAGRSGDRVSRPPMVMQVALGGMHNVSAPWAVGGAIDVTAEEYFTRAALRPRLRYWLGPRLSIEAASGPVFATDNTSHYAAPFWTSSVGLNCGDFATVALGLEMAKPGGRGATRPLLELRLGSYPGLALFGGFLAGARFASSDQDGTDR